MDEHSYNLLMANHAQQVLMQKALGGIEQMPTNNIMEALFREDLFRPLIANWEEICQLIEPTHHAWMLAA